MQAGFNYIHNIYMHFCLRFIQFEQWKRIDTQNLGTEHQVNSIAEE